MGLPAKQRQNQITNKFIATLSEYFISNPKLHFTINHSRIFNTYYSLAEVINIVITIIIFFDQTQAMNAMIIFTMISGVTVLTNQIPRISVRHNYFKFVIVANFILLTLYVAIGCIWFLMKTWTITQSLCNDMRNFYDKIGNSSGFTAKSKCNRLLIIYIAWSLCLITYGVLRMVCIILSYKAYQYTKLQWVNEETKKRRKLRYIQLVNKKELKNKTTDIKYDFKVKRIL